MTLVENLVTLPEPRVGNYEFARFNALRHGVLSQHTVLPWEDGEEYSTLLEALVAEHKPQGPTEEHLVCSLRGPSRSEAGAHARDAAQAARPASSGKPKLIRFAKSVRCRPDGCSVAL